MGILQIIKKSIVELPKAIGGISDTLNITDKVKNAPSINLVEKIAVVPVGSVVAVEDEEAENLDEGWEEVDNPFLPPLATPETNGLMSGIDKTKLDKLGENVYSTAEVRDGYWFEKPRYRKTIIYGALPNKTQLIVKHGISNIERIVKFEGFGTRPSDGVHFPLPFVADTGYQIQAYANKVECVVTTYMDRSSVTECYMTLYYTKTTDSSSSGGGSPEVPG